MLKFIKKYKNKNELISSIPTSNIINPTSNTAVTLVALVITIIVLLILSGITLSMVMGDSGIFKKAQLAKEETRKSTIIEIADRTALEEKAKAPMESNDVILRNTMDSLKNNDELKQIGSVSTSGKEFLIVDKSIFKIDVKNGTKYVNEQSGNDIILSEGDIKFTYVPEEPTNGNVKVKIEVNTTAMSDYTIQYKTENEDWKEYTQEIEIEKNCDIYARLQSIEGTSVVATGTIANIDKLEPKEFTPKVTATSNSIDIEAKTEDQEKTKDNACSGNIEYRFSKDNGSTWTEYQGSGNYTYTKLTQNTTYSIVVEAKDRAGNTKQAKVSAGTGKVEGIKTGDVVFTCTPSETTKNDVTIEITGNKTGMQLQYKTEKSGKTGEVTDWTNYTNKITITRNQSIYARVVDSEGQAGETYATGTITNIDKLPPNSFTPTLTATHNSITVTASTTDQAKTSDNASSGNIQYRFSKDNGSTWTSYQTSGSYTYTGLSAGTNYTIKVEAKDKVGNTIQGSKSIATKKTYTITYNANGGSGAPSSQTKIQGTNITLSSTKPTKSGYTFKGWGTSSSTTTVSYAAGATYSSDASITLYAIWQQEIPTIIVFSNGTKIQTTDSSRSTSASIPANAKITYTYSVGGSYGGGYIRINGTAVHSGGSGNSSANGMSGTDSYITTKAETVVFGVDGSHASNEHVSGSHSASCEIISIEVDGQKVNFK